MTKKTVVILISSFLVISFLGLVYHGIRHSRGTPADYEEPERVAIEIPHLEKEIDLVKGISQDVWDSLPSKQIELMYQVTVLPWPKSMIPSLTVKTFHNNKDIYFYLSWKDETENRLLDTGKFSDACAIMFPLEEVVQPATIMMGFMGKTNIWQWKGNQDNEYWLKKVSSTKAYVDFYYPFEEKELFPVSKVIPRSAANDLVAIRVGTITPKENQNVQGRGFWERGTWHVVFKRSLQRDDPEVDAAFDSSGKKICTFAIWNGETGDRGGRKSVSEWAELKLQ
jgi:hypothetical protein